MAKRLLRQKRTQRPSGLRRAGRALYRGLVVLSALVVVLFCAYQALVRAPEQAAPPTAAVPIRPAASDDPATETDESTLPTPEPLVRREGVYTFLLVATDEGGGNTDTIMVASFDTAAGTVGVVSIPRDTLVDRSFPKINGIYAREGIEGLREAVTDLMGIPIDYYVIVGLNGFQRLVNAVGGVDFYIPCDMNYDDPEQSLSIHYQEGMQHLDGWDAMQVARFRKNNDGSGYTDVGRTQTQQKLLIALSQKVLSWGSLTRINGFVDIFFTYVDTDLKLEDMLYFASQGINLDPSTGVETYTLEGDGTVRYHGTSYCYAPDPQATLDAVNRLINPYTTDLTLDDLGLVDVG